MAIKTISAETLLSAYNGKYKYVTMDEDGDVCLFSVKPIIWNSEWTRKDTDSAVVVIGKIAITEFQGKEYSECIYKAKPLEEDWVGTLCYFADDELSIEDPAIREINILKRIAKPGIRYRYIPEDDRAWMFCRPVRPDEIKFFNDDTSEE